jgi:polysaccharide export outer membrane protein
MKRKYFTVALLLMGMLMMVSPLKAGETAGTVASHAGDYLIGAGDVLTISVWNNEDLTKTMAVLPDGKIHFPLVNEIMVGGKSLAVIEKELKEKIHPFVPNPELSVMVNQVNSMLVYVIGKVNRPGRFEMNTNVNVLQALATAGGLNTFAKRNKIKIFREINGKTHIVLFEYDRVTEGEKLEQNVMLKRGDVVVVP